MQHENLIDARQFCQSHNLQISFIQNLQQYDLIEITTIEETSYFPAEQLPQLLLVICDSMSLDIRDKVGRRIARKRGITKTRIIGDKPFRFRM